MRFDIHHLTYVTLLTAKSALSRAVLTSPGISIRQSIAVQPPAPAVQLQKLYDRFNVKTPADIVLAVNNTNVISIPGAYDARYLCPVTVGKTVFNLDFDSGSSDLWVFSTQLSSESAAGHTLYDPTTSSTSKMLQGSTWQIQYADSSGASGNVFSDTVVIDNITVVSQAIEAAQTVSSQFSADQDLDGILGLAFGGLNSVRPIAQSTYLDNAFQQGAIKQKLFTVDLQKGGPGSIDFGYIDSTKFTSPISYVPVDNSAGFWNISGSGYKIGSSSFSSRPFSALLDTGTSLMVMDSTLVQQYWSSVAGASYDTSQAAYVFPCAAVLPPLELTLGSFTATVPGSYLNFASVTSQTCYGGLQDNRNLGLSILGDVFLKSQFVVFDAANLRAGFASKPLNLPASSASAANSAVAAVTTSTSATTSSSSSSSITFDDGMWHETHRTSSGIPMTATKTGEGRQFIEVETTTTPITFAATTTPLTINRLNTSSFPTSDATSTSLSGNDLKLGFDDLTVTISTVYTTPGPATLILPMTTSTASQLSNDSMSQTIINLPSSPTASTTVTSPNSVMSAIPLNGTTAEEAAATPTTPPSLLTSSSNSTTPTATHTTSQVTTIVGAPFLTTLRTVTSSSAQSVAVSGKTAAAFPIPTIPVFQPPHPYNLVPIHTNTTAANTTAANTTAANTTAANTTATNGTVTFRQPRLRRRLSDVI